MSCGVCGYSWCWTCGFASYNWFHAIQFKEGIFCDLINTFSYGFGFKIHIHWTIRLLATLIGLALMPAIFFIGCVVAYFVWTAEEFAYTGCFCGYHRLGCASKVVCFPVCFTWWLILLCLAIISAAVVTGLAAGPAYLIIIIIFMISIARFFCGSKKSNQTEAQKKLVEDRLDQKRHARAGKRSTLTSKHRSR